MTETPTDTAQPAPVNELDPERVLARAADDLNRKAQSPIPGRKAPLVAELEPAFPDLLIQECIGHGGMGAVYRARHKKLDRVIALKILFEDLAADPGFQERLAREARSLARLDHPHVLRIHNYGEAGGHLYLETEFVEGSNLRELMTAGRLPQKEALRLIPQICDALQYAHDNGVIHRDIKPENILIDVDGNAKIADFGLAKIRDELQESLHLTHTQQGLGTPHYIAPEQIGDAANVDHRADIYSVGVVLYEMLTGQLPIGRFPVPSKNSGESSKQLDDTVMRSLEASPARRFQSAAALKKQLATPSPSREPSDFVRRRDRVRNESTANRATLAVLAAVVACAALLLLYYGGDYGATLSLIPLGAAQCMGVFALRNAFRHGDSLLRVYLAMLGACVLPLQILYLATCALTGTNAESSDLSVLSILGTLAVTLPLAILAHKHAQRHADQRHRKSRRNT